MSVRVTRTESDVAVAVGVRSAAPGRRDRGDDSPALRLLTRPSPSSKEIVAWGVRHHQPRVVGARVLRSRGRDSGRGSHDSRHRPTWDFASICLPGPLTWEGLAGLPWGSLSQAR